MSYTHAWRTPKELDKSTFSMFLDDCAEIVKLAKREYSLNIDCDIQSPDHIKIESFDSNNFELDCFYFFRISFMQNPDEYGLYIDHTQPYKGYSDILYIACLVAAKYHFRDNIYISSDGKPETWVEGLTLASAILGAELHDVTDHLFDNPPNELKDAHKASIKPKDEKQEAYSIDEVDVAKLIRKDLKKAFPSQKFSVRVSRYSMGSSIHVSWNNGPSENKVEEIVGHYHGSDFDGSIDLKYSNGSPYCNDYISFSRTLDHDLYVNEVRRITKEEFGIELPSNLQYNNAYEVMWEEGHKIGQDIQRDVSHLIYLTDY